jgi:IclR family acetate operon transcriptional repressor
MASRRAASRAKGKTEIAARSGSVQSLLRALSILEFLASAQEGATLAEVVRSTRLAPSTAHRLLTTLQQAKHVQFDPHGARWSVGVKAFVVGSGFLNTRDIGRLCRPLLRRLVDLTGETANLAIEDEGMAVYLVQIESRQTMRAITRPGGRAFLHSSALGKAILAFLPESEVERILAERGMKRFTRRTLDEARKLSSELKNIRKRGFAIDNEEYTPGLRCVAAPVFDEHGHPIAALSVSGPTIRVTSERASELGRMVAATANELTGDFGGRPPTG